MLTNKVPGGHVNFITHDKFAELMEAIVTDAREGQGIQRYFITGVRQTTEDFFAKLQNIFAAKFGIEADVHTQADPYIETMCTMDESAIQALKPGFDWGSIDPAIESIVSENLGKRSQASRVAVLRPTGPRGK
jgi:hypothetical protein